MRVEGEVEFLEDIKLKKKVLEDRPFLEDFGFTPENPDLVLFKISKGKSYFWTMETAFEPKR